MANNNENLVLLVNPNEALGKKGVPLDFKTTQPDDLTIYVELTTQKRSRSKIVVDGANGTNENINGTKGKINFISGSDFDGKNRSLTTSYTDISSASLQSNDEDLEGFGIESIDITFDTAYTPLIKIKFIDVRGGMFQRGNDSKYSVFFELPYPLFNLKVKGYYGKTVSYCLHLIKWNALFNATTGNFEITAEFIGYTFAILTDLLLGYLRAIPYVKGDGENAFKSVKARYEKEIGAENLAGNQVITIDDMFTKIKDFKDSLKTINKNSSPFKKLVNAKKSVDAINNIKQRNSKFLFDLQKENNSIPASKISSLLFLKTFKKAEYNTYVSDMEGLIGELNELVDGISDVQKDFIKGAIVTDKILLSDLFDAASTQTNVILVSNPKEVIANKVNTPKTKYDTTDSRDINRLGNIVKNIENGIYLDNSNKKLSEGGFFICDFYKFDKAINNIIDLNSKVQSELIIKYQEELRGNLISKYNFNPSVQNVIRILMASAETFLISLQSVAGRASGNLDREATLKTIITPSGDERISDIPIPVNSTEKLIVYPFPLYVEKVTEGTKSQVEEAWIGGNQTIDTSVVDEIEFTEKLLVSLVDRKQADINNETDLNNSSAWFSINPLDTNIFLSSRNPYYNLNLTATSPDEYMRLLMYRTFTYLGLTNPYIIDSNSLKYMAYVEANNLFYGFPKANYNTATANIKTSIYDNYKDSDSVITHWLDGSDKIKDMFGKNVKHAYIKPNPSNNGYIYKYISQIVGNSGETASYIPISGEYSGEVFFDGGLIKPPSLLSGVNNVDFLGNYINCDESKGYKNDDNAKYLEIIPYATYARIGANPGLPVDRLGDLVAEDSYYNKNIKGKKIEQSTLDTDKATTTFDTIFSYAFYSNEFFNIKSSDQRLTAIERGGQSDLSAAFILNTTKGTRLGKTTDDGQNVQYYNAINNDSNTEIILKSVSFVSNHNYDKVPVEVSLFGSPLYYAQNATPVDIRNYAKSYLFLNTLPITGLYGDITNKGELDFLDYTLFNDIDGTPTKLLKNIFTKNAGFIKSPSLWLAWLGSIIWRYDETDRNADPIKKKGVVDGNPISLVIALKGGQKRHPTMPDSTELFHTRKELVQNSASMLFGLGTTPDEDRFYIKIDKAILGLPEQAKSVLIDFFLNWTDKEFVKIKTQYELFNDSFINFTLTTAGSVEMRPWVNYLQGLITQNPNPTFTTSFDSATIVSSGDQVISGSVNSSAANNISNDFKKPGASIVQAGFDYNAELFLLPYININLAEDPTNSGNALIREIFRDISVIVNFTPRTFKYVANPEYKRDDIGASESSLKHYLTYFVEQYQKLYDAEQVAEVDTSARDAVFGSSNLTFIKLNVYRHLKAIHDKWITDYKESSLLSPCGDGGKKDSLIDRFLFIDKNWDEIGNDFILNVFNVEELIKGKLNQSVYDVLSNIFSSNNFNFIALPNYVEYSERQPMLDNIFKPYPYIDMVKSDDSVGPKFICMYIGQTSTHLDIKNSQFTNDGFDLNNTKDLIKKDGSKPIPSFEINYGSQNQNYFKDIKLDQSEFVETEQSLNSIESISNSGDQNKATLASQNLFNVYQTRSYSAEVTALGMPLIQPMMYFQLNNIPMFKGAYVIISTSHTIKPNHMTTSFKGVRVKKDNTPINRQVIAIKDLNIESSDIAGLKYDINESFIDNDDSTEGVTTTSGGNTNTSRNNDEECGMSSRNSADTVYPTSTRWRKGKVIPYITIENRPGVKIQLNTQPIVSYVKTIVTPENLISEIKKVIDKMAPKAKPELKKKVLISAYAIVSSEVRREGPDFRGFNNNLTGVESSGFDVFQASDVNGRVRLPENDAQGRPTTRIKDYYSFSSLFSGLIPVVTKIMDRNIYPLQNGEAGANEFAWRYFRDWNGYGAEINYPSDCTIINNNEGTYKKSLKKVG